MTSHAVFTPGFARSVLFIILQLSSVHHLVDCGAVSLTNDNLDGLISQNQLVFLNFYTDWCRFSQILAPVFDEAATKINQEFPEAGQVLFGKIDCDKESAIAGRYHVNKYPTLKLIQNGKVMKREYRGQRSVEALSSHIRSLLSDPIVYISQPQDWDKIEENSAGIVAHIDGLSNDTYIVLKKVAMELRDDCKFYVFFKDPATQPGGTTIIFKGARSKLGQKDQSYDGSLQSVDEISAWSMHRCIPLVREITFDNAEELTEEGLPFLILFHHPDDKKSVDQFNDVVHNQLLTEKGKQLEPQDKVADSINFLTADGIKFSHPLHHLGKSQKDLPLIAIDSFRHMYLLPNFQDLNIPGKLKAFIQDLYSGKLHREFHYGPDPSDNNDNNPTTPPESTFRKLGPSRNRYTLLRDEL